MTTRRWRRKACAEAVAAKESFSAHLLDGVTGSGKTEVYFEAVAEALRQGKQALILLPEIALTVQYLERFAARFGVRPGRMAQRSFAKGAARRTYRAVMKGEVRVLVGARSALFLPLTELGLIIVDEELYAGLQAAGWRDLSRPRHGGGNAGAGSRNARCSAVQTAPRRSLESFLQCSVRAVMGHLNQSRPGMAWRCCRASRSSTCGRKRAAKTS